MALPQIDTPTFPLKIPSTQVEHLFRPYKVKEEKLLLMAMEAEESKQLEVGLNAMYTIIRNCSMGLVDPVKLASFDVEYLFLRLRAKSVSDVTKITFRCQKPSGNTVCGTPVSFDIELEKVEPVYTPGHTNRVLLSETVGVEMRYPKFTSLVQLFDGSTLTLADSAYEIVKGCVGAIYTTNGDYYDVSSVTAEQLDEFLGNLTVNDFQKFQVFFDTMPKLELHLQFECPKCKHSGPIVLSGLRDFLASGSPTTL